MKLGWGGLRIFRFLSFRSPEDLLQGQKYFIKSVIGRGNISGGGFGDKIEDVKALTLWSPAKARIWLL